VAVAGVIGGKDSEITGSTRSLFLESANFDAYTVRKGATKIGARTDAGTRFEKSLDPALTTLAIRRFMHILQTIQPEIQITSNLSDTFVRKPKPITIHLDKSYLDRCIGKELSTDTVIETLESLEFNVRHEDGDFTVRVPSFRATRDISLPVDLVEEVTRIYGYDNIEPRTVEVPIEPLNYNEERLLEHKVKETLAEKFGFSETHSYTWYDNEFNRHLGIEIPAEVKIVNPHAREMNVLRTSIVPVMLQFAQRNVNQFSTIPVFEIGKVYYNDKNPNECDERKNLCILSGDKDRGGDALFYQLKGIVTYLLKLFKSTEPQYRPLDESLTYPWLHPEKSVSIYAGERHLGYLTVVHPSVRRNIDKKLNIAVLELNFTDIYNIPEETRRYSGVSKYPEVSLDFSFLVDRDTHFKEVDDHIAAFKSELLIRYHYVVMYEGKNLPEGKKSLTFAFTIGSREKTLVTEDIDQFLNRLVEHMKTKGYTLR
ncbi:MAG: phenylalanine--tRNA ligase subunit beta, partial [bacterium]|nr:phenylalanine--tRNA ligase subunit beta [bacterium]